MKYPQNNHTERRKNDFEQLLKLFCKIEEEKMTHDFFWSYSLLEKKRKTQFQHEALLHKALAYEEFLKMGPLQEKK